MKIFIGCYVIIGLIFHAYIKNTIDWIGIDFIIEQLPEEQRPKNFDYNSTLSQVVLLVMCIITWPYLLVSMFRGK